MCRYIDHHYRSHFICFDCKVTFKGINYCPHCGKEMVNVGFDFAAPKKSNKQQWKKLELLHQHKIYFHSCGCTGPGYRPKTYQEAKRTLK